MPKNASSADYHAATGLETLIGWLFFRARTPVWRDHALFLKSSD
jgi:23S rRNA maturation mini-RNase III